MATKDHAKGHATDNARDHTNDHADDHGKDHAKDHAKGHTRNHAITNPPYRPTVDFRGLVLRLICGGMCSFAIVCGGS